MRCTKRDGMQLGKMMMCVFLSLPFLFFVSCHLFCRAALSDVCIRNVGIFTPIMHSVNLHQIELVFLGIALINTKRYKVEVFTRTHTHTHHTHTRCVAMPPHRRRGL